MIHSYFVTAARGVSERLAVELEELGCRTVRVEPGGCRVRGPLELGYRICLWSRVASRVLMHLADLRVPDDKALYDGVLALPWEEHLDAARTLAVDFVGQRSTIAHGQFGAQRTKDAIVDRLREQTGARPDVDLEEPDVRVNVFSRGAGCSVAIDLSGAGLHRRGWRTRAGAAPLRETVAATMLRDAGWAEMAQQGAAFVDPMAGSGTLVFEALAIAADVAPGLKRDRFGFVGWKGHDKALWQGLLDEATARAEAGLAGLRSTFVAADEDVSVIEAARSNAEAVGWAERIAFEVRSLDEWTEAPGQRGLVATNPPYGHRLGGRAEARRAAGSLGRCLTRVFTGWRANVLLGDERLVHVLGSVPEAVHPLDNGTIEASAVVLEVGTAPQEELRRAVTNRIEKNRRKLKSWLKKSGVTCYRIYDADIPEANVAIDRYEDWAVVAEYEAPASVDPKVAEERLQAVLQAVPKGLGIDAEHVVLKTRRRQRGTAQYEKQADFGVRFEAHENGHRFWVNLEDYLDTGLFLDHRPVRELVAELVAERDGASFLNLFSYTSTATVYAIGAGARRSTSVDMSNTYLDWSRDNLRLAGADLRRHELVRADVLRFLADTRDRYDVILLDPPTFSSSKKMKGTLDIQRDHADLIRSCMSLLAPEGELIFSTNARKFRLDPAIPKRYAVTDVTRETIPPDYARRQTIHQCWRLTAT